MIFISYRISDSLDLVDRLDGDLTREFGHDLVFRDKSRLKKGHDWDQALEHNAKSRRVMLVARPLRRAELHPHQHVHRPGHRA